MKKEEFCIMPEDTMWSTKRYPGLSRHEAFFGLRNRRKCIDDGLVVFLTTEQHEGACGVHGKHGSAFDDYIKQTAQKAWMKYYVKSEEEFRKRYGRNYL